MPARCSDDGAMALERAVVTRSRIAAALAEAQLQLLTYIQALTAQDALRPLTESQLRGAAAWSAKDHLAHLANSERNRQRLLGQVLAAAARQDLLRLQYPAEMVLPPVLGDWDALTPDEQAQLEQAVAERNQAYVDSRRTDTLDSVRGEFVAAREDTVRLLDEFTDDDLTSAVPTVIGDSDVAGVFGWGVSHPADHLSWIQHALARTVPEPS